MLFLHQLTFSTKIFICRKTNIFIFNALANKDTCRKSNRVVYMYYVEKIFFWDMFLGVPFQVGLFRRSTLAFFHVAGSFLACNVTERLRTALLPYYP